MSLKNITLCMLLSGMVSACGHYSEDLASMDSMQSPALQDIAPAAGGDAYYRDYSAYLADEYAALAHAESDNYDYKAAAYFTKKAMVAREGGDVGPSDYKDFDISDEYAAQVMEARENLNLALTAKNVPENYATLAKAQAQYDSFLEQLEEGHQTGDIKDCQASFYEALNMLQAPQMDELNYAVGFAVGQSTIDAAGVQAIQKALTAYQENPNYEFTIVGYNAPQETQAAYQGKSMAAQRAANVKATLVQAGVPSYMVRAYTSNEQAVMYPVSANPYGVAQPAPAMPARANIIMRLQDQPTM